MPVLKIVQATSPRLSGLSLHIPDGFDMGNLGFHHLSHLAFRTNGEQPTVFLNAHKNALRTVHLENPSWSFPAELLNVRNLTHIHFLGQFPPGSRTIEDIFTNGRQLECLSLSCLLDTTLSTQFRSLASSPVLPFLRGFTFAVSGMTRRAVDRDLFPAIAEFLRDRRELLMGCSAEFNGAEGPLHHIPQGFGTRACAMAHSKECDLLDLGWYSGFRCEGYEDILTGGGLFALFVYLLLMNWDVDSPTGHTIWAAFRRYVRYAVVDGVDDYRAWVPDGAALESWVAVLDGCEAPWWTGRA